MSVVNRVLSAISGNRLSALILASGDGKRMGAEVPKQFMLLNGKSVLARSVEAFERAQYVDEIVIVTKKDYLEKVRSEFLSGNYKKVISVVEGGETRFESAFRGMESLTDKTKFIAVHDAARCLVTPEMIDKVAASAFRTGASFAASAVSDTVKLTDKSGRSIPGERQLDRSHLVAASTPQIFKFSLYIAAAYTAKKDNFSATDDCSLIEHAGFPCTPVDVGRENIKLTSAQDIATAEYILKTRGESICSQS